MADAPVSQIDTGSLWNFPGLKITSGYRLQNACGGIEMWSASMTS
jgi:hypothetical protein